MYVQCAIQEEERADNKTRQCLDFIARILVGSSDEPTEDKPITSQVTRDRGSETVVKKVLDIGYDSRIKNLAEESMRIKRECGVMMEKLRTEIKEGVNG